MESCGSKITMITPNCVLPCVCACVRDGEPTAGGYSDEEEVEPCNVRPCSAATSFTYRQFKKAENTYYHKFYRLVCTHMHARIQACTHTSTHARRHAYTQACIHAGSLTHVRTQARRHARTHARTHVRPHARVHACMQHACMHACLHAC